jgi:hypothetical protein
MRCTRTREGGLRRLACRASACRVLACLLLLSGFRTGVAQAQTTDFVMSSAPITFPSPTLANFSSWPASAVGPVTDSVAVPFTVTRTGAGTIRITDVLIRCTSVIGGKACDDIEWRYGPSGPWRALTMANVTVDSRFVIPGWINEPWSGVVWMRVRLSWTDPAPSVMTSGIALTLSVYRW